MNDDEMEDEGEAEWDVSDDDNTAQEVATIIKGSNTLTSGCAVRNFQQDRIAISTRDNQEDLNTPLGQLVAKQQAVFAVNPCIYRMAKSTIGVDNITRQPIEMFKFSATGVMVSPNHVVTDQHFTHGHNLDKRVYLWRNNYSTNFKDIDKNDVKSTTVLDTIEGATLSDYTGKRDRDPFPGEFERPGPYLLTNCDVSLCQVDGLNQEDFVVPSAIEPQEEDVIALLGYPTSYKIDNWLVERYNREERPSKDDIRQLFSFGFKQVSVGKVLKSLDGIVAVNNHSYKGYTGGGYFLLGSDCNKLPFVGIHIGGGPHMDCTHNNFMSVNHKAFVSLYAAYALPSIDPQTHSKRLEPWMRKNQEAIEQVAPDQWLRFLQHF
jgi:hypothetical protein